MRRVLWAVLIPVAVLLAYLLLWPVPIDPAVFAPPANPGRTGVFAPNEALATIERVAPEIGPAPEDVNRGPDGFFYTGLLDGRIVRFRENGTALETFVNTGGRPLGIQFDAQRNLVVADATRGLLRVTPDRRVSVLVDHVGGQRLLFVNDLDIAADGTIWFSDSSRRFNLDRYFLDFLEARPTGRLLNYDPKTGETKVRMDGLMFANGVALGPDDSYVLVNETFAARITRLWLTGPKAGQRDTFLTLPGYPDNLSYNQHGTFWVALVAPRMDAFERLWQGRFLRNVLARMPTRALSPPPFGWVIGCDPSGNVVRNLQDGKGRYSPITSVHEIDGKLYFGSIRMSTIGRYNLP